MVGEAQDSEAGRRGLGSWPWQLPPVPLGQLSLHPSGPRHWDGDPPCGSREDEGQCQVLVQCLARHGHPRNVLWTHALFTVGLGGVTQPLASAFASPSPPDSCLPVLTVAEPCLQPRTTLLRLSSSCVWSPHTLSGAC